MRRILARLWRKLFNKRPDIISIPLCPTYKGKTISTQDTWRVFYGYIKRHKLFNIIDYIRERCAINEIKNFEIFYENLPSELQKDLEGFIKDYEDNFILIRRHLLERYLSERGTMTRFRFNMVNSKFSFRDIHAWGVDAYYKRLFLITHNSCDVINRAFSWHDCTIFSPDTWARLDRESTTLLRHVFLYNKESVNINLKETKLNRNTIKNIIKKHHAL